MPANGATPAAWGQSPLLRNSSTTETYTQRNVIPGSSVGNIDNESMTSGQENQPRTTRLRSYLLRPNNSINVAAWNVRTMFEASRTAQIAKEMRQYNISILGISEARWTGSGKLTCNSGETIIYSGKDQDHQSGVAVMMSKETAKTLIEWYPVNDRIIYARFDSKHIKLSVIQCYSPTNDASDEDEDAFYNQLQSVLHRTPKHDMVAVMGDLNAKVGCDNIGREACMGAHGIGQMNENGERLLDFCEMNGLVVCNTIFAHRDIHKYTWVSPDKKTKNQIDYIMINKRWRRSVIDTRTYRGADVNSDHILLRARIQLKLRAVRKVQGRRRFAVHKLKQQEVKEAFKLELRNRFSALEDLEDENNIDGKWDNIRDCLTSAATEKLGFRKSVKEEWLSADTWNLISERKRIRFDQRC